MDFQNMDELLKEIEKKTLELNNKKQDKLQSLRDQIRLLDQDLQKTGELNFLPSSTTTKEDGRTTDIDSEVFKLRKEVELLRSALASGEKGKNLSDWNGEIDYNHPGVIHFAKTLHKKWGDVYLPKEFDFSLPPSGKLTLEITDAKILWTNLCTIIKILEPLNRDWTDEKFDIMGLTFNMLLLLATKCDYVVVLNTTDEETAKLFKSMKKSSNLLVLNSQEHFDRAVSLREAQYRVGANVLRQCNNNNFNSNYNNNSNNNGNYDRGRGNGNHSRDQNNGQQYHEAVKQYLNQTSSSGTAGQQTQ